MTLTIGICDDKQEQVDLLRRYLNGHQDQNEFVFIESTKPDDFLRRIEATKPHLVFLDIDMGEISGISLGEKIKALHQDVVIVYITAYEKYALEAFQVRAFHYLLKPLTREKFDQVLEEAIDLIKRNQERESEKILTVQTRGELIRLNYSDIFYFEKIGHRIKVHTKDQNVYFYSNLSTLLQEMDAGSFVQCHQGFVVNVDKIRGFRDKTLFLEGNVQVPVSRSFVENIREMLASRLFAGKEKPWRH